MSWFRRPTSGQMGDSAQNYPGLQEAASLELSFFVVCDPLRFSTSIPITEKPGRFLPKGWPRRKMSDIARQASSHDLIETSGSQRNAGVFAIRMALEASLRMWPTFR